MTCDIHQWNGFDWFSQSWLLALMHAFTTYWIMLQMTRVYIFAFVVKWKLVLWQYWALLRFVKLYEALWCMWVFTEWLLNWNEEVYNMGNKLLKSIMVMLDSKLLSPGPRTFQGNMWTPCDIMFLHMYAILFTGGGGCIPACNGAGVWLVGCDQGCMTMGVCDKEVCDRDVCDLGGVHPLDSHLPCRSTSGRYETYWNAFLLNCVIN